MYLSLRGVTIPNDDYVLFSDIGTDDTGLHCNTDRSDCCRGSDHPNGTAQGHWYRPNGREVLSYSQEDKGFPRNFISRNRVAGIVRLNVMVIHQRQMEVIFAVRYQMQLVTW